jgi:hypothetical protein
LVIFSHCLVLIHLNNSISKFQTGNHILKPLVPFEPDSQKLCTLPCIKWSLSAENARCSLAHTDYEIKYVFAPSGIQSLVRCALHEFSLCASMSNNTIAEREKPVSRLANGAVIFQTNYPCTMLGEINRHLQFPA